MDEWVILKNDKGCAFKISFVIVFLLIDVVLMVLTDWLELI